MIERHYLEDAVLQLRKLKGLADKAIGQINDEQLFMALDPEANSIAVIMKHISGNMRSRWTDFLTSDGEKPNRDRDSEFVLESDDTRAKILSDWEKGWNLVFRAVSALNFSDIVQDRGFRALREGQRVEYTRTLQPGPHGVRAVATDVVPLP